MQNIMYCSAGYSHNLGSKAVVSRWLGELGLIVFTNLRKEYYQSCKHFVRNDKQPYHPKSMLRKGTFVSIFLSRSFRLNKWHFPINRWPMHLASTRFSILYVRWPALFDTLTPGFGGGGIQYKINCQFGGRGGLIKILKCLQTFEFYTTIG